LDGAQNGNSTHQKRKQRCPVRAATEGGRGDGEICERHLELMVTVVLIIGPKEAGLGEEKGTAQERTIRMPTKKTRGGDTASEREKKEEAEPLER